MRRKREGMHDYMVEDLADAKPVTSIAQLCAICGRPNSPFGFRRPETAGAYVWYCRMHRHLGCVTLASPAVPP